MSAVYDRDHVRISEIIGRRYNNPLGEAPFGVLRRLLGAGTRPRVLDLGCGRGASTLWWARQGGAQVVAVDPSAEMLEDARRQIAEAGLSANVELLECGLDGVPERHDFDLVLAHDVLCYVGDKAVALARIGGLLAPGGIASVTDYHASRPVATAAAAQWAIEPPPSFERYQALLSSRPLAPLLVSDTTRQYRGHWAAMREALAEHEAELLAAVGPEATQRYAARATAILETVGRGEIGHLWAVLERDGAR